MPVKHDTQMASVYQASYEMMGLGGKIDKQWTGKRALSTWAEGIRHGLAARYRLGESRFVDMEC